MKFYDIGVLIPHYNNIKGLSKSLSSLDLFNRACLVLIDDGSDAVEQISIREIELLTGLKEEHIYYKKLVNNGGIEQALNTGLRFIKEKLEVKYILRLDAGDICVNQRIVKQKLYLDEHPEICLVGSSVRYVNENGNHLFNLHLPVTHEEIKKRMLISVSFIHSAIMFRTSALERVGYYTDQYPAAEDYAFFYEFLKHCSTANISEILTEVEWNIKGISVIKRRRQLASRIKLTVKNRNWSVQFFYGLVRLILLYILPYAFIQKLKRLIYP